MEPCFTFDQAMQEAARCLLCHDAPCSKECPAATDPARFIRKLRFRNLKGAVALLKENNILAGVCGVVCPTCELCGQGCTVAGLGEPIQIGRLQRFLVEYGWGIGFPSFKPPRPLRGPKVAVVGAGPSGLTCASQLARLGFKPVVFEKRARPGGMLQYAIPEHRLGRDFLDRELEDVRALGVEIRCGATVEMRKGPAGLLRRGFDAVYLATGAWECAALDVPRRPARGVWDALSFLEFAKHDQRRFSGAVKGRGVAVVGGGDAAMDAAMAASLAGAREVSVIYRRSVREMPGSAEEQERAFKAGINFMFLVQPIGYLVERGKLCGLRVVHNRLGRPDDSGRARPIALEGSEHELPADLIVEALGLAPGNRIRLRKDGAVAGASRVYAGGDLVRGSSLVSHAVADGKAAAASICKALGR